jgi:hypothetical protein
MSDENFDRNNEHRTEGTDGRRRQLRNLILHAADTARQTRRVRQIAAHVTRPVGRAVRDRVSMLLSAAG